jgi:hypothetical protein
MGWRSFYARKMHGYLASGAIEMALPMARPSGAPAMSDAW